MTENPKQGSGTSRAKILFTGGGTGGHVYPGLAVAEALLAKEPKINLRFVGTNRGLESVLVPRAGHRFTAVPASGVRGLGGKARLFFVMNFLAGFLRSLVLLLVWRPALVLGTGGYVIGPVMAAARVLGIPCVLQEQNAIPGSANRLVARWARKVYLGFAIAEKYFKQGRTLVSGNPVRAAFGKETSEDFVADDFLDNAKSGGRVLVFGGSGGARTLNKAMAEGADSWANRSGNSLWIQTGKADLDMVKNAYAGPGNSTVRIDPYIDDMPRALAWADLVICRAGAMTLAELQAIGKAAILVPFPHATDNHQLHNAENCAAAGAGVVIQDHLCTHETLFGNVEDLLSDPARLSAMGEAAKSLSRPDAAEVIASDILLLIGSAREGELPVVP